MVVFWMFAVTDRCSCADTRQSYFRDWMGNFLNTSSDGFKAMCNKGIYNVHGCLDIRFRRERDTNLPANLVGSMHAAVFHPGDQRTAKATHLLLACVLRLQVGYE